MKPLIYRANSFFQRIFAVFKTQHGRDVMMFLLCLCISAVLWVVMSFSEEEQFDLRLPVEITHIPDSVTLVSPVPSTINVSLTAHGTQMIKLQLGRPPVVSIDFRAYSNNGHMQLSSGDLKALVRRVTDGTLVGVVSPDTLNIAYTTHPGYAAPIILKSNVTVGFNSSIAGDPKLSFDSVRIYYPDDKKNTEIVNSVLTEDLIVHDATGTFTKRLRIIPPTGARVIPDSVDVTFKIEPLILKQRKVVVETVNVPKNEKLIVFPAQVDVSYMLPMSVYSTSNPQFDVQVDYKQISPASDKLKLQIKNIPDEVSNVQLACDSVEYVIEQL